MRFFGFRGKGFHKVQGYCMLVRWIARTLGLGFLRVLSWVYMGL